MQNNQTDIKGRYSLSGRLLLWLMLCLFIILSISAVVSYSRAYRFANLAYDRAIFRVALALSTQVDVIHNRVVIDLPQIAKDLLEYDKDDELSYRISAPNGDLVVGEADLAAPKQAVQSGKHIYYDDVLDGEKIRVVAYALPIIHSKLKGDLLIQVAETRTKREFMVQEIIGEMLIPQILIMLITAGVIFFSIRHSLSPLTQLKNSLAKRSPNDLSLISTENTPQEVTPLLDEMNGLMLRVKAGVDFQKTFIADASHQLRTPITVLQNQVELALREQVSSQTQRSLENIAAGTQHLARLVQQLLALARVEPSSKSYQELVPVDLMRLAQELTAEWVPRALSRKIDLGFEAGEVHTQTVSILGNTFMLKEMLSNLIENALCYTPQGGEVTVAVLHKNNQAELQVIDNGVGIPVQERELVFNRFYRIADNVGDGCGLGLAIVKEIAVVHDAEVTIKDGLPHVNTDNSSITYGTNITVSFKCDDNKIL